MKNEERHQKAVEKLTEIAGSVYDQIDGGKIPKMMIPLRTKSNIRFDPKTAVWKYGKAMGARSAKKLTGAQMLLRTMYMLEFIEDMIKAEKSSTLREMYYISEGWDEGQVLCPGRVQHARGGPRDHHDLHEGGLQAQARGGRREGHREHHDPGARQEGQEEEDQLQGRCRRFRVRHPVQRREGEDQLHRLRRRLHHRDRDRRYVRQAGREQVRRGRARHPGAPQGAAREEHAQVHQARARGDEAPGGAPSPTGTRGASGYTRPWRTGPSRRPICRSTSRPRRPSSWASRHPTY